jgi:hypothetical protein
MNRGSRLQTNLIRIHKNSHGQFSMTIPVKIARSQSLDDGCIVHIEELYSGGFSVKKIEIIKDGRVLK